MAAATSRPWAWTTDNDPRAAPLITMNQEIQQFTIYALPLLFAITLHEAAHGYVAKYFGDNSAYMMGRVSLNPARHIDPVGTILIPLVLLLFQSPFLFGYAKPVPVNFGALRNPKRDMIWVALAGPASNFIQAFCFGLLLMAMNRFGVQEAFFYDVARAGIQVNLVLCVFNLFPIPPLDGGRVLTGLLPLRQALALSRMEPYGFFIVMALIFTGIASTFWLSPLMRVGWMLLQLLLSPFRLIL